MNRIRIALIASWALANTLSRNPPAAFEVASIKENRSVTAFGGPPIHDLEEINGTRYLVLELVGGGTLSDRIAQGPIPVKEVLIIAKQICEQHQSRHVGASGKLAAVVNWTCPWRIPAHPAIGVWYNPRQCACQR